MSWISIDIRCGICEHHWDELVPRPAPEVGACGYACPECGGEAYRTVSAPRNLRASHPDGYSRGPGYAALKEAARLRATRADMPHEKRTEINTEIRAVEKAASKGYSKKQKGQK